MTPLEQAYREAGPKILGYLTATGTDEAAARDILHDAVERVAKAVASGREPSPGGLAPLLFAAARNLRKNFVRDNRRLSVRGSADDFAADVSSRAPSPASAADAPYLRMRMTQALAALPPALRETYSLYQIGGLSVRETAALAGVSENLVKVRLHRAKTALRKSLADLEAFVATADTQ